ncbi:MAG TPA: STAS domain-containing protein [Terriglobia bacterium]|nr:STAS domain-containing protein [Terriglobia bacterium]
MRISIRFKDDIAIMSLSGKFLAGSDGPFLRQKVKDLTETGTKKLIVDFAGVPYIDSTGLGFLVGSRKTAESAQATLVLANLNPHVKRILDNVRLSPFFLIAKNEADAFAKLKEQSETAESPARKSRKRSAGSTEESQD